MIHLRQRLRLVWCKFKRLIEFLAYGLFDSLVLFGASRVPRNSNRVAVVNLKLLGDYFLWLPFGKGLVAQLQEQGGKVVFVGNAAWIALVEQHFPGCETVGVGWKRLIRDFRYRMRVLRGLRTLGVSQVLHPSYPRDAIVEDAVVRAVGAPAIGFDAGFPDRPGIDLTISNRLYSHLLPPIPGVHQSVRSADFLHAVGSGSRAFPLDLPVPDLDERLRARAFFLLSPGASQTYKRWPVENWIKIIRRALECNPAVSCVITGTPAEAALCRRITDALPERRCLDLCGKTDLSGFIGLIAHARWVLCNDSAAGHIAAVYGVPSVVVLGGGNFGRCYPYPESAPVNRRPVCVWNDMPCFGCNWICRYGGTPPDRAHPCIERVGVEAVWAAVAGVMDGAILEAPVSNDHGA
ncbi:lipopolysaccharide core biosynthesis protein [bacterium BMS3Bbin12]|nr:lipopolysaccharide core biosynthesis protein [bacterium BMS3Bbin12]